MSFFNDITAAVGFRQPYGVGGQQPTLGTGQQPGGPSAAQRVTDRFAPAFVDEFSGNLQSVLARGSAGEFDDQALRRQEQDAVERLRRAQLAAGATPSGASGAPGTTPSPSATGGGIGGEAAGAGTTSGGGAIGSGSTDAAGSGNGTGGANAAPGADDVAVAEHRELYELRVRQSEARLQNVSASLAKDFPLGAAMESASSGRWDPATFEPQSREQAEALAQRLVIDATEAAARLQILDDQLTAAKFELAHGGGAGVANRVAELEGLAAKQQAWVEKLATVVDRLSGGKVTEAGQDARAGRSMRGATDAPVDEIVAALVADGKSEAEITRIVGALEMPIEQEKTPGGSQRLKSMASDMSRVLVADFNRRMDRMREERADREEQRQEEQRLEDKRADRKQADRQIAEQRAAQRQAQLDAEWQQWLAQLAQQSAQQRQAG